MLPAATGFPVSSRQASWAKPLSGSHGTHVCCLLGVGSRMIPQLDLPTTRRGSFPSCSHLYATYFYCTLRVVHCGATCWEMMVSLDAKQRGDGHQGLLTHGSYSWPPKVPQRCSQVSFPHGTTSPNCQEKSPQLLRPL